MKTPCKVEDCSKPVHHGGLCSMHAARLARTGTTDPGVRPNGNIRLAFSRRVMPGAPDECWEWQGTFANSGYGRMGRRWAHRVAWELHNGRPIPPGLFVLHSCDNPPCVNPHHLRIGTPADNSRDAVLRGRLPRPPGFRRIKPEDVPVIRALRAAGTPRRQVAERYGISERQVVRICARKAWSDVA